MEAQGMAPTELTAKLGITKGRTTIYPWINGTSAPSPPFRTKLMKILSLTKAELTAKDLDNTSNLPALTHTHTNAVTIASSHLPKPQEVLQFTVLNNGQARIRLDVMLEIQDAMPLMRLLMDAEAVKNQHTGSPQPVSE
jgi:hypothetical protein